MKKFFRYFLSCSLAFGPLMTSVSSANVFSSTLENYGNFGNTELDKFLAAGWKGYLVVADVSKGKRWISYSCGEDCTRWLPDQCPDGDCKFFEDINIYKLNYSEGAAGSKPVKSTELVGTINRYDNGDHEQTTLTHPDGFHIAKILEQETQSRAKFDETQTQTFTVFDQGQGQHDLGYIIEMDAPNTINQPESVYRKNDDGSSTFLTTVIERIGLSADPGVENRRWSTLWCEADLYAPESGIAGSLLSIVQSESFDIAACKDRENLPVYSNTDNGLFGSIQQFANNRFDSNVFIQKTTGDKKGLATNYDVGTSTDNFCFDCDGSEYWITMEKRSQGRDVKPFHIFTDKFSSKSNKSIDLHYNYPKAKWLNLNNEHAPDIAEWRGGWDTVDDFDELLENPQNAANVPALLIYEKYGEVSTGVKVGSHFERCEQVKGDWGGLEYVRQDLKDRYHDEAYIAQECNTGRRYTLYYHILIPPNAKSKTNEYNLFNGIRFLDRVLSMMPDQTQSSPELKAAEEYIDFIKAFDIVEKCKNPLDIPFELMVDIGTEEDHLTTQNKALQALHEMGFVGTKNFVMESDEITCSGSATTSDAPAAEVKGEEDEF